MVEKHKHCTLTHIALVIQQTAADDDYVALVKELDALSEKDLRKRLKQLYPTRKDVLEINKKEDVKEQGEKKKEWR